MPCKAMHLSTTLVLDLLMVYKIYNRTTKVPSLEPDRSRRPKSYTQRLLTYGWALHVRIHIDITSRASSLYLLRGLRTGLYLCPLPSVLGQH